LNRAQAAERLTKLRAMADPERGASPAERKVAKRKMAELLERFPGLPVKRTPSRRRVHRTVYTAPSRQGPVTVVAAFASERHGNWHFDPKTGEARGNVQVHSYSNRWNWHIEVAAAASFFGLDADEAEDDEQPA
jgi:hypothetical protein